MGLKPIAYGRGPLPDCVDGLRHVFAPGVTRCRCGARSRPEFSLDRKFPIGLGLITTPRERKEQIA